MGNSQLVAIEAVMAKVSGITGVVSIEFSPVPKEVYVGLTLRMKTI